MECPAVFIWQMQVFVVALNGNRKCRVSYPKILGYGFGYKEPFWRQKDTKSYVKVHKGGFAELRDSHKILQEKRDFKMSGILITAWSRVQVLPGPPSPYEKRHLAMRCLFSSSEHPSRSHGNAAQGRCRSTKSPMSAKTSARFVSTRSSCRAPG